GLQLPTHPRKRNPCVYLSACQELRNSFTRTAAASRMNADGVPSAGSAPVVKLQIFAVKNSQNVEHIVKKTAKGHEVVEVDGFTFIRKRDLPASAVEAPLSKRLQAEPLQFPILAVEQLQAASAKPAALERTASHGSVDQPLSLPA
ncbi:hypothetical protein HaLaN_22369, partial [Haematococcus lacustris]